jgi:hypothetical protein
VIVFGVFILAAVIVALALVAHVPLLLVLPAIGVLVAVLTGYLMRRTGPGAGR